MLEPMTALEQLGAFVATHQPDERARAGVMPGRRTGLEQ